MQTSYAAIRKRLWLVLALCSVFAGACNSGQERLAVFGTVTGPESTPISGTVVFTPAKGHTGPGASASLHDGKYQFDGTSGPLPGPHQVMVVRAPDKFALQ